MSGTPTKLKAANLWLKTSAAGNPYFTGRLGGVKVLILENRARAGENDPTHHLFFVDGENTSPKPAGAPPIRGKAQRPHHSPATRFAYGAQPQRSGEADSHQPLNDDIDDLWPERGP
jgi:hypothetical protein